MAGNLPPHGEILRLSEIHERGPAEMSGKCVRVMGKLTKYDAVKQVGVITATEKNSAFQLTINTQFIEPFQSRLGSMFQFIGEIMMQNDSTSRDDMVVQARVVRCVDGIDATMYYNASDMRRRFLESRNDVGVASSST